MDNNSADYWVESNVCKSQFKNWVGSTPCCGSVAYLVEDGKVTEKMSLLASVNAGEVKPAVIDFKNREITFDTKTHTISEANEKA